MAALLRNPVRPAALAVVIPDAAIAALVRDPIQLFENGRLAERFKAPVLQAAPFAAWGALTFRLVRTKTGRGASLS